MSILYLFLLVILAIFIISAFVGFIRFILDIKKFSSLKAELDNLITKYTDKMSSLENELKGDIQDEDYQFK